MITALLNALRLLLPALIPSWRFFKSVQPSPRVEWTADQGASAHWQEVTPRPKTLSLSQFFRRMFWNPTWNESLYMVSLSERLIGTECPLAYRELERRVKRALLQQAQIERGTMIWFRLTFITREKSELSQYVLFTSPAISLTDPRDKAPPNVV